MTRQSLLLKGHGDFDVYDLERSMETFVQAKIVRTYNHGSNQVYELTEEGKNLLFKNEEKKDE